MRHELLSEMSVEDRIAILQESIAAMDKAGVSIEEDGYGRLDMRLPQSVVSILLSCLTAGNIAYILKETGKTEEEIDEAIEEFWAEAYESGVYGGPGGGQGMKESAWASVMVVVAMILTRGRGATPLAEMAQGAGAKFREEDDDDEGPEFEPFDFGRDF